MRRKPTLKRDQCRVVFICERPIRSNHDRDWRGSRAIEPVNSVLKGGLEIHEAWESNCLDLVARSKQSCLSCLDVEITRRIGNVKVLSLRLGRHNGLHLHELRRDPVE